MQDQMPNFSNDIKHCSFKHDFYFIIQATILLYAHSKTNWSGFYLVSNLTSTHYGLYTPNPSFYLLNNSEQYRKKNNNSKVTKALLLKWNEGATPHIQVWLPSQQGQLSQQPNLMSPSHLRWQPT